MPDVLFEKVFAGESSLIDTSVYADLDVVLIEVVNIYDAFRAEDAVQTNHNGFVKYTRPFGVIETMDASFMSLPAVRVLEGSRAYCAVVRF